MDEHGEEYLFSDELRSLIPPKIVDAMKTSNRDLFMEKVQEEGKTTWWILQQVLILVKEEVEEYPFLKKNLIDLLQFVENRKASQYSCKRRSTEILKPSLRWKMIRRIFSKFVREWLCFSLSWLENATQAYQSQQKTASKSLQRT
jgi:hypothetical protein